MFEHKKPKTKPGEKEHRKLSVKLHPLLDVDDDEFGKEKTNTWTELLPKGKKSKGTSWTVNKSKKIMGKRVTERTETATNVEEDADKGDKGEEDKE